jgi:predicted protein tyrosine phosphatase
MRGSAKDAKKLLFVCSRNRIRSLTAEKIIEGVPGYEARSAGTQPSARVVITEGDIGWADMIFVMEKSHMERLLGKFPDAGREKRIVVLDIPDDYGFMDDDLVHELRAKLEQHLTLPGES